MLRYDNCVPATEADAHAIERCLGPDRKETIALLRYVRAEDGEEITPETGALHANSHARWRTKFGWDVVKDEIDPRDM